MGSKGVVRVGAAQRGMGFGTRSRGRGRACDPRHKPSVNRTKLAATLIRLCCRGRTAQGGAAIRR